MHARTAVAPAPECRSPSPSSTASTRALERAAITERLSCSARTKISARARYFDRQLPYSWTRCALSMVSYVLLLSDVLRSQLGVNEFRRYYPMLGPNEWQIIGPWNYPVFNSSENTATTWVYKQDTTSIVWRAFAQFFDLQTFPRCLFYEEACASEDLDVDVVFAMIDDMATTTARWPKPLHHRGVKIPTTVALRSANIYRDRVHDYLLSQIFKRPVFRTNQATHFPPSLLRDSRFHICERADSSPMLCGDPWTNFRHSCGSSDCEGVGLIWDHILARVRTIQEQFPGHSVDLTILESREDMQLCRGGLSFLARAQGDVSTIIRARTCAEDDATTCSTTFLADYRYETILLVADGEEWYMVLVLLRLIGQGYCYVRVIMLLISCYVACASEGDDDEHETPHWKRLLHAVLLFVRVPSQAIVYGSPLPILFYALAHTIDAPVTYEILENNFTTSLGEYKLHPTEFARSTAIQMRSLWLLATAVHAVVWLSTARAWTPDQGVPGVPEYVIALLASATVLSQLRLLSFRNTRVVDVNALPTTRPSTTRTRMHTSAPLVSNSLLQGVLIDVKFLLCEYLLLVVGFALWWLIAKARQRLWRRPVSLGSTFRGLWMDRTPVPFTATNLWPAVAMCILWRGPVFREYESTERVSMLTTQAVAPQRRQRPGSTGDIPPLDTTSSWTQRLLSRALVRDNRRSSLTLALMQVGSSIDWPIGGTNEQTLQYLLLQMEHFTSRRSEVHAIVGFINLVNMSDPLVWFQLRVSRTQPLGYYESTRADRQRAIVLLPIKLAQQVLVHSEVRLIKVVDSGTLPWSELIQCG